MDDPGEPLERWVASELEFLDEHLEGAVIGSVRVVGARGIERTGFGILGSSRNHVIGRQEQDLRVLVDESAQEPGTSDPVCLRARAGDPAHDDLPCVLLNQQRSRKAMSDIRA